MAEPLERPAWAWEIYSKIDQLRADHESSYREFRDYQRRADGNFASIEKDYRTLIILPNQVEALTNSLNKLSAKLDDVITAGGTNRRGEWSLVIQVCAVFVSLVAILFTVAHVGVHP